MWRRVALYVDTSAVLRAVLERGVTPEIERRLREADTLVTSRLALVESARTFVRARRFGLKPPELLAAAEREVGEVWSRCLVWELTPEACALAGRVVPDTLLRTLDALHLATYVLARQALGEVELLTADRRLADAVAALAGCGRRATKDAAVGRAAIHIEPSRSYSARNALAGSTRDARRAGPREAAAHTASSAIALPPNASGSAGRTS